jgi:hypothetical protein
LQGKSLIVGWSLCDLPAIGYSRSRLFQMLTHRKRFFGADTLPPSDAKLVWPRKLGTFAHKIASERIGDQLAGFGYPVKRYERPKSRATAFAEQHTI